MRSTLPPVQRGFTLIELLVTIAIAALLGLVAVPNIGVFMRNAELTSATNNLVAAISTARSEALKRGTNVMVLPASGTSFNNGWVVFVDANLNNTYDSATDILISSQDALPNYFTVSSSAGNAPTTGQTYILYNASGFPRQIGGGGAFLAGTYSISRNDLTGEELLRQTRRIKVASTGRVRTCNPKTDTDCGATGS